MTERKTKVPCSGVYSGQNICGGELALASGQIFPDMGQSAHVGRPSQMLVLSSHSFAIRR